MENKLLHQNQPLLKNITHIFCDIDGTLLNGDSRLEKETIAAVQRIAKKIPFVLVSGRNIPLMMPIHRQLGLDTPLIGANGSFFASASGETLSVNPLQKSDYVNLLAYLAHRQEVAINVYTETSWYTNHKDNVHVQKEEIIVEVPALELVDLSKLIDTPVTKIILMGDEGVLKDIQTELERSFPHLRTYHNYANYIEIFDSQADKGLAIHRYMSEHHLNESTIMAIGDSLIDASMFDYVKIKVAMGNAPTFLKEKANIVVPSNRENGVAILLEMM